MKRLTMILMLLPFLAAAQQKGIDFEQGLSWDQLKEKAKLEHKYIFMDCFATWCVPCRRMDEHVFTTPQAGEFFNKNFISIRVQVDQTKEDSEQVKSWYVKSKEIARIYGVQILPTFLFFSPDGEIVHKLTGGCEDASVFIKAAAEALDPSKQAFTLLKKFDAGERDPQFLKNAAVQMLYIQDQANAVQIFNAYMSKLTDPFTRDNIEYMSDFALSSKSKAFELYMEAPEKINVVLGVNSAEAKVMSIIRTEDFLPVYKDKVPHADWALEEKKSIARYPKMTAEIHKMFAEGKKSYDLRKQTQVK